LTILIDPPNSAGHGRLWSHLASDESFDELHRFAGGLGIPLRGFDRDHYDIPAERYDEVVAAGAVPVSSRELINRLKASGLRRRKAEALRPRRPGQSLVRARRLVPGDAVAVVAPSGPVPADRLEAGVEVLRSWGLEVREQPGVRRRLEGLGYLSGTDTSRAADLVAAWADPDIAAVVAARGGYGAQRMLGLLDWDALASAGAKVLLGFSDITALHQAFGRRLGLSTVHGPVLTSLGAGDDGSRTHLRRMLFSPEDALTLTPEPVPALVGGHAEGVLVGGNLTVLAAEVGTPTSLPADGSIAVLEDVGEDTYRLDRALTQLLRSGWFDGVRGIVLGGFTGCDDDAVLRRLFEDRLAPLGVPTLLHVTVGHADRNLALPFGVPAVLDADTGTLTLRDPALS
jgi:muramoyltetrapeptide carboxypeptidase